MTLSYSVFIASTRFSLRWMTALLALIAVPWTHGSGTVKSKTNGTTVSLPVFFPSPTTPTASPEMLVVPLLGPGRTLLPGGKLLVWVGLSDGTPLADASVVFRVQESSNPLASAGTRVTSVTLRTGADGIAGATLAAPNVPKGREDPGGTPE